VVAQAKRARKNEVEVAEDEIEAQGLGNLFSNFDMDRLTRQENCALFRELSLYNRELVYVTFSVQLYRNCNQIWS